MNKNRMRTREILVLMFAALLVSSVDAQYFDTILEVSELNGSNGFALIGESAGDDSGAAVSGIGDINDDGIADLIVGAPFADTAQQDAGISYVMFGGPDLNGPFSDVFLSGLNGTNGFALLGASAEDNSGAAVGFAGDVNADGSADLVIGAPSADPNGASSGTSYVLYGGPDLNPNQFSGLFLSAIDNTTGLVLLGGSEGDISGASVAAAGDVNADGHDDLMIGAPGASPGNRAGAGNTYVVFGGPGFGGGFDAIFLSGLNGTNGFALTGVDAGDESGLSVSGTAVP